MNSLAKLSVITISPFWVYDVSTCPPPPETFSFSRDCTLLQAREQRSRDYFCPINGVVHSSPHRHSQKHVFSFPIPCCIFFENRVR